VATILMIFMRIN